MEKSKDKRRVSFKVDMSDKKCLRCEEIYTPTGVNQKYCPNCKDIARIERHKRYMQSKRKGYNQLGENNNNWKGGIGVYTDIAFNRYGMKKYAIDVEVRIIY